MCPVCEGKGRVFKILGAGLFSIGPCEACNGPERVVPDRSKKDHKLAIEKAYVNFYGLPEGEIHS